MANDQQDRPNDYAGSGSRTLPGQFSWFRFQHVSAGSQGEPGVQVFSRVLKQGDVSGILCADFGGRVFLKLKSLIDWLLQPLGIFPAKWKVRLRQSIPPKGKNISDNVPGVVGQEASR